MRHQFWNKAKLWFLRLGCGVIVLCLAGFGYWRWINIPPQVKIPTPVMPNPNGYDYFLRAGKAFVPDDKGVDKTTDVNFVKGKTYPLAAKEAWLKQNEKALRLLREGLKYPALHAPVRSLYAPMPEYGQFRGLARLLAVESHTRAERGDWSGAADSTLDTIEFGYNVPRGASLISELVGVAIQAIGLRELGNLLPRLDAQTSRKAAARLKRLYDNRFPYYRVIQEEKWEGQASILEIIQEKSWRLTCIRILNVPDYDVSRYDKAMILVLSKQALLDNYSKIMDAQIANARLPYSQIKSAPAPGRMFLEFMNFDSYRSRWNRGRVDTNSSLTVTMLALRAFRLEKGRYPANLKELVPEYMEEVLKDPFDDVKLLHYKLQKDKYKLWSIGPDGIDNGGKPIINKNKKGRAHNLVFEDSRGDVVAGINVPG